MSADHRTATIDVPASRVTYFDPVSRTFRPAAEVQADPPAAPAPEPAPRLSPIDAGRAAGAAWAEQLATFADLDLIAAEAKRWDAAGFVAGFAEAAAAVRAEFCRERLDTPGN